MSRDAEQKVAGNRMNVAGPNPNPNPEPHP